MQIVYENGIYLPGPQFWIDPHSPQSLAIVSHAHADHTQKHEHIITTPATAAMMRLRGVSRCHYQPLSFGETIDVNGAAVTLYPAGHILGSAQVLVEWQGTRLLYSGDFKLRPGLSAEQAIVPQADMVIMETTFGKPRYRFPDTAHVTSQIIKFCRDTLEEGLIPVLFCYSLGKGQEVHAILQEAGLPIYLHAAHWKMACLYRGFGINLPECTLYESGLKLDGVLLCASGCRKGKWFNELLGIRTAYISGWAATPGARWRFNTDDAFALSDHADYDDLLEYVRLTGAGTIYTVHGFADEFSADLRALGHHSHPLRPSIRPTTRRSRSRYSPSQLSLPI